MDGKICVVTGATQGLGAAIARRLAAAGAAGVVITGRDMTRGQTVARALSQAHDLPVHFLRADFARIEDCRHAIAETERLFGRIDVLVNSAGHGPKGPLLGLTDAQWHLGLDMYFLNVVRAVRSVAPIMVQQKSGSIVNISTAWVVEPSAMFPTSAVARAGLAAFTKLFADENAVHQVRMNNVLPGWIDSLPAKEERRESVPMQRYGTSEEVAATIAFLASDAAAYITGQNIRVDGGLMRSV